ncbi:hypothetical protein ACWGR4_10815 [Embleya sp. NPDC055664]|uniref:hypothetical protein n=1 Tax=Embleya sp. NPDC059237 TaxID=3346784 RepID=UPI0036A169D2
MTAPSRAPGLPAPDPLFEHTPDPLRYTRPAAPIRARRGPVPAGVAALATVALLVWAIRAKRR